MRQPVAGAAHHPDIRRRAEGLADDRGALGTLPMARTHGTPA